MDDTLELKRVAAFKRLDDAKKTLYGSEELGKALGDLIAELGIQEQDRRKFIDVVGDAILGLDGVDGISKKFESTISLSPDKISRCNEVLKKFLQSLSGSNPMSDSNLESKERLLLRPDEMGKTPEQLHTNSGAATGNGAAVGQTESSAKPLTRDELMSALAGKRTMASDIEAVRRAREAAKRE
jgi:hypothetical protein